MKATALRALPVLVFLFAATLGALGVAGSAACSNGTTPVCDDAGSCLLVPPSSGTTEPPAPDAGGDAGATD